MKTAEWKSTGWKSQLRIFLCYYLFHISKNGPVSFFESPNFGSALTWVPTPNEQHRSRFQSDQTVTFDLSENNNNEKRNSNLLRVGDRKGRPSRIQSVSPLFCIHLSSSSPQSSACLRRIRENQRYVDRSKKRLALRSFHQTNRMICPCLNVRSIRSLK